LFELLPTTRETARRLGLVTIGQIVRTLVNVVEHPPEHGEMRILEVPKIRGGTVDSDVLVIR
jgi:hypothetical protein